MYIFLFIVQACLTYRLYPALALSKHLASLHTLYNLEFEIGNLWVNELKLLCIRILTLKLRCIGFKTPIKLMLFKLLCIDAPT